MPRVSFQPEAFFREKAARVATTESARIQAMLPAAHVEHIGGTSIPGALTKGDVDLVVRLDAAGFNAAIVALQQLYSIHQPENWTPTFASFKADTALDLPFGAQVVVAGSADDLFLRLRDRLRRDSAALAAYNTIKRAHQGGDATAYWQAKTAFIEKLLAERDAGDSPPGAAEVQ